MLPFALGHISPKSEGSRNWSKCNFKAFFRVWYLYSLTKVTNWNLFDVSWPVTLCALWMSVRADQLSKLDIYMEGCSSNLSPGFMGVEGTSRFSLLVIWIGRWGGWWLGYQVESLVCRMSETSCTLTGALCTISLIKFWKQAMLKFGIFNFSLTIMPFLNWPVLYYWSGLSCCYHYQTENKDSIR